MDYCVLSTLHSEEEAGPTNSTRLALDLKCQYSESHGHCFFCSFDIRSKQGRDNNNLLSSPALPRRPCEGSSRNADVERSQKQGCTAERPAELARRRALVGHTDGSDLPSVRSVRAHMYSLCVHV